MSPENGRVDLATEPGCDVLPAVPHEEDPAKVPKPAQQEDPGQTQADGLQPEPDLALQESEARYSYPA